MHEASSFSQDSIERVLLEEWGVTVTGETIPMDGGTSCLFKVPTDQGDLVLKELPTKDSKKIDQAEFEPRISHFLHEKGVPSSDFLPRKDGKYAGTHAGRVIHLQRFIEGTTYWANSGMPDWLLPAQARTLGRIHAALAGMELPDLKLSRPWLEAWDGRYYRGRLENRLELARALEGDPHKESIVANLGYCVESLPNRAPDVSGLTFGGSHGDYQAMQIICGPTEIRAVIDFTNARNVPFIWEVLRSWCQSAPSSIEGTVDVAGLTDYAREYLAGGGTLNRHDAEVGPELYRFVNVFNRVGYDHYLVDKTDNREEMLGFGFWRTDIARWFGEHGAEVTEALLPLVG